MTKASNIARTLATGGVSAAAAQEASNILTNPSQATISQGPVQVDYTPAAMRLITAQDRKYRFGNLDWEDNAAYRSSKRPQKVPEVEARLADPTAHPLANSQPITVAQPTNDDQVLGDTYIEVRTQRRNTFAVHTVRLKPGINTGTHARFNPSTGSIDSVPIRWNIGQARFLRGLVTETPDATELSISLENLRRVRVRLPDSNGVAQYQTILCWTEGSPSATP